MPPHGRHCAVKARQFIAIELKRRAQAPGSVAIWTRGATFELLDAMHAQASPLGQRLLCQAGRLSMLTRQIAKGGRSGCGHSRASLSQGFLCGGDPPAIMPA